MEKWMFVSAAFQMKFCYNSFGFLEFHQKNKVHHMISLEFIMVMLLFREFGLF